MAVALAASIAWAVFLMAGGHLLGIGEMPPPSLATPEIARPAEFRWSLLDLDGKPVEFADFRGRPILLNIWATWCGPCLEEMPSIARLAAGDDLKGRDIAFVCVSTDESAEGLRQFMKTRGKDWPMTVLRATSIPPVFQTEGIPATFLIGPDGKIASFEMGAAQWDDPSVVYFLQKMAASGRK